jgi:DNA-binding LytR/AlgR family response regulator
MAAQEWTPPWMGARGERVLARGKHSIVVLDLAEVWAFEAKDRLVFVHSSRGRFDVDVSLLEIELSLGGTLLRVHRCWLANLTRVLELGHHRADHYLVVGSRLDGEDHRMRVPISRELATSVKELLLAGTVGVRPPRRLRRQPTASSPDASRNSSGTARSVSR